MGSHKKERHNEKHKHKHHHHKKSSHKKKKKHKRIELDLEDKLLQNALDCLESGPLKEGKELPPEVMDKMVTSSCVVSQRASMSDTDTDTEEEERDTDGGVLNRPSDPSTGGGGCGLSTEASKEEIKEDEIEGSVDVGCGKWRSTFATVGEVSSSGSGTGVGDDGRSVCSSSAAAKAVEGGHQGVGVSEVGETVVAPSKVVEDEQLEGKSSAKDKLEKLLNERLREVEKEEEETVTGERTCADTTSSSSLQPEDQLVNTSSLTRVTGETPLHIESQTPVKPESSVATTSKSTEKIKVDTICPNKAKNENLPSSGSRNGSEIQSPGKSEDQHTAKANSECIVKNAESGNTGTPSNSKPLSPQSRDTKSAQTSDSSSKVSTERNELRNGNPTKGQEIDAENQKRLSRDRGSHSKRSSSRGRKRSRDSSDPTEGRARKRSGSRSKNRSCSRSRTRNFSGRRKRSHSRSRKRRRTRSRERNRSRSRKRSRSSSRRRSGYRNTGSRSERRRSHSKSRRKTPVKYRMRNYSRSSSRDRGGSSSRHRRRQGRSRSRGRDRSRTRRHSHCRSRSRSTSSSNRERTSRRNSRSRQRHRRRYYSSSRSRSTSSSRHRSPKQSENSQSRIQVEQSVKTISKEFSSFMQKNQKTITISKLTDLCRSIQKEEETSMHDDSNNSDDKGNGEAREGGASIRAPFALKPAINQPKLILHNNVWKTTNQIVLEANAAPDVRPLTDKFPVSAGLHHKASGETEPSPGTGRGVSVGGPSGSGALGGASVLGGVGGADTATTSVFGERKEVNITDVAVKRMQAMERLRLNPADVEAHMLLHYVQEQTRLWTESQVVPGKFTGQQSLVPLTKEAHKTGMQAWAKKTMFHGLAPVTSSFGLRMMKKMGWDEGQPLGKSGVGHLEPLAMDVKVDRTGLSTVEDKKTKKAAVPPTQPQQGNLLMKAASAKSAHLVQGKHPVSALLEICNKKHMGGPVYELIHSSGPSHKMNFLYEVSTPMGKFRPSTTSNTKKLAKMEAARAALQALGLLQKQ